MIVVSDTSPLCYLILIGQQTLLQKLYGQVFIPPTVLDELSNPHSPEPVRAWADALPNWIEVRSPQYVTEDLYTLDAGEASAIALARELQATILLIDERAAVRFARNQGLFVTGILGVLLDAANAGIISLEDSFAALEQTSFHRSPNLLADILRRHKGN